MKILSTIAFFYKKERLNYLQKVIHSHQKLVANISVFVLTNTQDPLELNSIHELTKSSISVVSFQDLPNPWYLTWAHKQIIRDRIDDGFDYFIYSEDDIEFGPENFEYWLRNREVLSPHGFYPSFIRVEYSNYLQKWVSTDIQSVTSIAGSPVLLLDASAGQYINFSNPYQGMFLYDLALMKEHLATVDSDLLTTVGWHTTLPIDGGGVAERANFALTYTNIQKGFYSRNLVRFHKKFKTLDPASFVHHLPNNYANRPDTAFGKIPVESILSL